MPKKSASLGWGIFYQMVNIGGFIGPLLAGYLRILDWEYVFLACAAGIALNFIPLFMFAEPEHEGDQSAKPGKLKTDHRAVKDTAAGKFNPDLERIFTPTSHVSKHPRVLLTPPASLGLLPGVLRASLIDSGAAREAELGVADLADGFLIGNALRAWR